MFLIPYLKSTQQSGKAVQKSEKCLKISSSLDDVPARKISLSSTVAVVFAEVKLRISQNNRIS